jgi:hypothetical protein
MPRRIRSDIKTDNLEKKLGVPEGTIRYPSNGRKVSKNTRLKTIRGKSKKR